MGYTFNMKLFVNILLLLKTEQQFPVLAVPNVWLGGNGVVGKGRRDS